MNLHPTLNPDLLLAFTTVAETRHFTQAAQRLNSTQSTVSMQIKRLEDKLQVSLFKRSKRDVALTKQGEILLRYAHRISRLTDEALTEIGLPIKSGKLRIAATDMSLVYLPKILQEFHNSHPLINIELHCKRSWDALDMLDSGLIDLAFVTQHPQRQGAKQVSQSQLVWACANHSDVATQNPIPLAVFGQGCIYRESALTALKTTNKPYRLAYESPSRAGLDCAVNAGLAATITPQDCLTDNLRIIGQAKSGLPPLPKLTTYLFQAKQPQSPAVKAFSNLLLNT